MAQNFITPSPNTALGATFDNQKKCVNFALESKNATKVILCIFEKHLGEDPVMNLAMTKREGTDIWETSVKTYALGGLKGVIYYGYRLFGPNWEYDENFEVGTNIGFKSRVDENGNRFNPNKIAYDPYSKELSHLPSDSCPNIEAYRSGGNLNFQDNAKIAPKSVFWLEKEPRNVISIAPRPFSSEIIGEVHIKDLTRNLHLNERGTYLGAAKFAPKLKEMGFTTIEFLPLMEFDHREDGQNYWGYMTLGFFAPARHYAYNKEHGKTLDEFRFMINEFHKNGLKVCMDVVFNHTGEARMHYHSNEDTTLLSWALIDNSHYYKLSSGECAEICNEKEGKKYYRSNSGCHNDTNIEGGFYNLVADSVAFWAKQGVDAFRFDLAVSLMDVSKGEKEEYDKHQSFAAKLTQELLNRGVKVVDDPTKAQEGVVLIAEPWTCGGENTYQLGNFPYNWLEWNDVSRDTIRRAALFPTHINFSDVKNIFEGTKTRFKDKYGAINYICCHDGFSLYDCNSFSKPYENTSGGSKNEICFDNNNDENTKENAIKKELAMLFMSKGVPMLQVGDILCHSKCGNNNSYNHDDETNYYDYMPVLTEGTFESRIFAFTRSLMKLRKENGIFAQENINFAYFNEYAQALDENSENFFNDYSKTYMGIRISNPQGDFFIAFSKGQEHIKAFLPNPKEGKNWHILFDTFNKEHKTFEPKAFFGLEYILNPNSLVVFKEK